MEVKDTTKKSAEGNDQCLILDFYKDWDSEKCPVMMSIIDSNGDDPGEIESEDERKMGYLRKKYQKMSK